jgi:hypothetical protein
MTTPGRAALREYVPPPASTTAANGKNFVDRGSDVQLSPSLRAELLDLDAGAEILTAEPTKASFGNMSEFWHCR